jgi:hypothetical protein
MGLLREAIDKGAGQALFEKYAGVAQLVEQLICNQPVGGSSPFSGLNKKFWWGSRAVKGNRL